MMELTGRPLLCGEVLFDQFDDGAVVLGGAPFNVVWHLNGFGLNPLLVSRIGNDELGHKLIAAMSAWGLDQSGLQVDDEHPTGRVKVALRDGQPSFDILAEQAYDFIDGQEAVRATKGQAFSLLYFGSLIARHEVSRRALQVLQAELQLPAFVDVNLRPPWWSRSIVEQALHEARWVKLNDQELVEIMGVDVKEPAPLAQQASQMVQQFELDLLVVTCGAKGALISDSKGNGFHADAAVVKQLVDTVGAGDAFSAVTILGLMKSWPASTIVRRAGEFAAAVCAVRGATIQDRDVYKDFLKRWQQEHE